MNATRSTLRAGRMQAGDNLAAEPVAALLADVRTVDDADTLAPILDRRLSDAVAAREAHGGPDPLSDDATQDAHAAAAAPLDREMIRCRAAVESLVKRRDELVAGAARADAERRISEARTAMNEAEAAASDYVASAQAAVAAIERQRAAQATIEDGRRAGREHGLDVTDLQLPHERRSRPEEFETVETIEHGIRRRLERRVRSALIAPNLCSARIELPAIDGGAPLLSQGLDRR